MPRPSIAFAALQVVAVTAFADNAPALKDAKSSAPQLSNPELAAAAAAAAAHGWIHLVRDPGLTDWQRVSLPPDAPLDARNPWSYEWGTGILRCDGTGLREMLLHRTERGDGIFHVEWRYVGTPAKPNSGVFVRTKPDYSAWHQADLVPGGLGMLLGVTATSAGRSGRFNNGRRRPDLMRKSGEWNTTELVCMGPRLILYLNGVVTADWSECGVPKGLVGLKAEGAPVEFRGIKFKPLP